ncbi:hypothetical protein FMEAI12_6890004 [Parafrankia sp. Ea1.12]|nr:hypothetical protein FMEAI12_6890004 [Parafrankia sp. Ea1.12]
MSRAHVRDSRDNLLPHQADGPGSPDSVGQRTSTGTEASSSSLGRRSRGGAAGPAVEAGAAGHTVATLGVARQRPALSTRPLAG